VGWWFWIERMKAGLLIACVLVRTLAADVLNTAAEVRGLSEEQVLAGRAVEITGVVTWDHRPHAAHWIVQDETSAIYVHGKKQEPLLARSLVGQRVRVRGVSGPGGFAPLIRLAQIEALGPAPLPAATPVRYEDILSGRYDCQRVEIEAVVERGYPLVDGFASLKLSNQIGDFSVGLSGWEQWQPQRYEDARLLVRGCVLPLVNSRKELLGFRVMVTQPGDLQVMDQPSADPFSAPLVPLERLRPYHPQGLSLHRQRVQGRVTHSARDGALWLEDGGHALRCQLDPGVVYKVGSLVEASGYLRLRDHFASLLQARVRVLGPPTLMVPTAITPERVAREDLDGRLVSLTGTLRKMVFSPQVTSFYLESQGELTEARLYGDFPAKPDWQEGAELALSGIVRVRLEQRREALDTAKVAGFHLHLRGYRDVKVIKPISWWTPQRVGLLGIILAIGLAVVLSWAALLRAQVSRRTRQLAREIEQRVQTKAEHEATLRERNRLAADLHDTLAQSFTAVGFQLQAARVHRPHDAARADEHLRLATQLLEHGSQDLRRSLRDLRARMLEGRSLSAALLEATQSTVPPVQVHADEASDTLPDFLANQLFLFAQEAVSNALKHAAARSIHVDLATVDMQVTITITDDGHGFNSEMVKGPSEGHFGITGMRERALRMGGELDLRSGAEGTAVMLRVPF
jgi:signal transduction histidine kinase